MSKVPEMSGQELTHPDSNNAVTTVRAPRPFVVRSADLEACMCHEASRHDIKCSYHEALKVNPKKRTKAMKAVIKSQELASEAGRLLLSTRAKTQDLEKKRLRRLKGKLEKSDEAVVMVKSIVKLIKASLLHHGICDGNYYPCVLELELRLGLVGVKDGFEQPLGRDETPLERAKSLSWLHLLAAVPLLMAHLSGRDPARLSAAVQTASIALALMQGRSKSWEALFFPHGLYLWEYGVVVRMHKSQAIFRMPAGMPTSAVPIYAPIFRANAERIYSVQPTNKWNILFCHMLGIGKGKQCQVLRKAIKVADDEGDESSSMRLRYALCHAILLGAEGPSFSPKEIMSIIGKAINDKDKKAEFWTVPGAMSMLHNIYWPCTGAAVHFGTAVKQDPFSFGLGRMPAFASAADLEREKRHIMCAYCGTMCCLLTRCNTCNTVGYCSSDCQIEHWKAGHKTVCKQQSKP